MAVPRNRTLQAITLRLLCASSVLANLSSLRYEMNGCIPPSTFSTKLPSNLPFLLQIVLETEYDNTAALALYESLGFIREKRLYRFYMNGKDAFRLVLVLPPR